VASEQADPKQPTTSELSPDDERQLGKLRARFAVWTVVKYVGLVLWAVGLATAGVIKFGWVIFPFVIVPLGLALGWLSQRGKNRGNELRLHLLQRVEPLGDYPPFVDFDERQRQEFLKAVVKAMVFKRLPAKFQSAILEAERNRSHDLGLADLFDRLDPLYDYPPLVGFDEREGKEFSMTVVKAGSFEDLPAKFRSAILEAEQNRSQDSGVLTGQEPRQSPGDPGARP
jgi:hypothetical protein